MATSPDGPERSDCSDVTRAERQLRAGVAVVGLISAAFIVMYVVTAVSYESRYPFVANSVAKDGLFVALAVIGVGDIRRYAFTAVLLVLAHLLLVLGLLLAVAFDDVSTVAGTLDPSTLPVAAGTLVWVWIGADLLIAAVLTVLYLRAQRARYRLRYLSGVEFSTLRALAEVLTPDPQDTVPTLDSGRRVDTYLAGFRAQGKWRVRLALIGLTVYPLLTLHPPFSMMSPKRRLAFVRRRMLSDVWGRRLPGPVRTTVQAMIRAAQQLAFIGYYEDPRAAAKCGYVRFSERPDYGELVKRVDWDRPRVSCLDPADVHSEVITTDVAIVGSGAAGSVLAHELARQGREVLILERGLHVDPSDFSEVESEQLSRLYADGALTLSRDFRFQILQGMCVGGSTVVNNGVCFEIPERALAAWQDPDGLDAGLDAAELRHSFAEVERLIRVRQLTHGPSLNAGWRLFEAGIDRLRLTDPPYEQGLFQCNIDDCLGCGYCNIGCRFGKKLSMLESVLPKAQQEFGEAVRILAQCEVDKIETGDGRALALHCRLGGRKLRVRANRIVLSAGAVASSIILARSGLGGRHVGRHLGFNLASPLTAEFEEELHSERGLQMTNYLVTPAGQDCALETWFNPIASQSLFMPGWFDRHYENMLRYPHMTCVGAVVGTRRNASVKPTPALLGGGVSLKYTPDPADFRRLVDGLKFAGRIMLAAGATRVMPPSFRYLEARSEDELSRFDELRDNSDLSCNSAHPQGGNCLSRNPRKGVVDSNFAVHGIENLYVCDASVFPAPITVNPQLTVMALAHYAARRIAAPPPALKALSSAVNGASTTRSRIRVS
jgi:choline dehydrogenase-like flavoprotein